MTEEHTVLAATAAVAGDRLDRSERSFLRLAYLVAAIFVIAVVCTAGYVIATVGRAATQDQIAELRRQQEAILRDVGTVSGQINVHDTQVGRGLVDAVACLRSGVCPP